MSEAAHDRAGARVLALDPAAQIVVLHPDGSLSSGSEPVTDDQIAPEVVWVSLDLYPHGQLGRLLGLVLRTPSVRWIQSFAAGVDNPVFNAIMAKGIRLSKSSAQGPSIAEYVVCNALSLLHPIARYEADKAARRWRQEGYREIASTRWTLVGFGAIGVEVARRLQPFGPHVTVLRRSVAPETLVDEVRPTADLLEVAALSDVVVLACALNDETRGLAGEAFFRALKPGAILINVGRGDLLDEAALRAGLDRDQPAFAVLDVFATEPLPEESWIWTHPKIRVSPHFSGGGDGVMGRGDVLFLENLTRYARKAPLLHEAQPSEVGL